MSSCASDVRGGFNTYVEKIKDDGNAYTLTAIKFGTTVRPLFANLALSDVPKLTGENYTPCDTTALYDAIGYGLDEARKQWSAKEKPYGKDRILFIIMTDGFENASKEFNKETIVTELKKREEAGNWTIVYMGADQDAWAVAGGLGIAKGNVLSYASTGTSTVFRGLATNTSTTSGGTMDSTTSFFGN